MTQVIVHPDINNNVIVRTVALNNAVNDVTGEWLPLHFIGEEMPEGFRLCTVEDIAEKDSYTYSLDANGETVATKHPYVIVDQSLIPADQSQWQAWEYTGDPANPIHINPAKFVGPPLPQQLDAFYETLPVDKRVKYGQLKSEVKAFLEQPKPDIEAVHYLIQNAPVAPEDEQIRQAMLTVIPSA